MFTFKVDSLIFYLKNARVVMHTSTTGYTGWKPCSASFACQDIRNHITVQIMNDTLFVLMKTYTAALFAINVWKQAYILE